MDSDTYTMGPRRILVDGKVGIFIGWVVDAFSELNHLIRVWVCIGLGLEIRFELFIKINLFSPYMKIYARLN